MIITVHATMQLRKKAGKKKECISLAILAVRERNFNHGDDIFIYPHLCQPNKIV